MHLVADDVNPTLQVPRDEAETMHNTLHAAEFELCLLRCAFFDLPPTMGIDFALVRDNLQLLLLAPPSRAGARSGKALSRLR